MHTEPESAASELESQRKAALMCGGRASAFPVLPGYTSASNGHWLCGTSAGPRAVALPKARPVPTQQTHKPTRATQHAKTSLADEQVT